MLLIVVILIITIIVLAYMLGIRNSDGGSIGGMFGWNPVVNAGANVFDSVF